MLYIDGIHKRIEFVREVLAKPKNQKRLTWGAIATVVLCLIFSIFSMFYQTRHVRAALSNCTWTNGAGTNFWNNAGNWSCGNVPTNANNVILDGAVSSATMTIDVAATAASFTVKGTNLPTTGDVAYAGAITANQNLTLDTTNAGTGSFYLGSGTYVANATTITVPGNWTTTGTFTYGTSTVNLTGTGTASGDFYNLTCAAAIKTTTFTSANHSITNVLTVGTGTLTGGFNIYLSKTTGTPFVTGGGTITGLTFMYSPSGAGTVNITGATYGNLYLNGPNATSTFSLAGNITTTSFNLGYANWGINILDTTASNYSITTTAALVVGQNANTNGRLLANGSTITVGGNLSIATGSGVNYITAGTSTINVAGNWTNADTFTANTSTVNLTGNAAAHQIITTNARAFNNFTLNNTQVTYNQARISGTFTVSGNLTVTAGVLDFSTYNPAVNIAGNFSLLSSFNCYNGGSGMTTFNGTTSYTDLTPTGQAIGPITINGTSVTVVSGKLRPSTIALTSGSLIQTAGSIITTGAVTTSAGTFWTNNGTGDVTLGGNVTNAGTVTFNGDEAGGQDSISILSSAASARTWTLSGGGTFSFTDVSVVYQTGAAPITATSSNDGGNNTSWTFATNRVISGSLYNGIGGSKITAAKTVKVTVNGVAEASTVESSSGDYTLTLASNLAANDIVGVFLSSETEKASAITKTSVASSGINIDLFQNYTTIRHEGTIASLANSDIATADNIADSDFLVTADGSNVATFTQGVYIMGNKTYAPGAGVILNTGSWANYGSLGGGSSVTFSASSGTQTVFSSDTAASPYTGTLKGFYNLTHSGAGTLQITSNLDVNGNLTNSSGSLDFNSLTIFLGGNWVPTGGTFTTTGTLTMDNSDAQTLTTAGQAFGNLTFNNTGIPFGNGDCITVSGNLDINGTFTIIDGRLKLDTNNPNINTSGAVNIGALGGVVKGTGTWTFDGTTTYTDSEATKANIGVTVVNGTSVTLGSSMTVDKMTVTSGTLNLGTAGYTLKLANNGSTANVLSVSGTMNVGTNSTVQYAAVNSGGNVNVLTFPYNNLQFTPISGSESYDMTGSLTGGNAMTGSVTIDANATVNTYVGTTSYDISCVDITINTSGTLYAGTNGSAGTSTYNVSRNWNQANGTFTYGMSTVNMTGTGTITGSNTKPVYMMNAAAAGQTTTLATNLSFSLVNVLTLGTGSLAGTGANTGFILAGGIATPLVTSGATMNIPLTYYPGSVTQNVVSTTYQNLIFNSPNTNNLAGDITAQAITINRAGGGPTVNANTHSITCTSLTLGYTTTNYSSTFNLGSGTLTVSGDVTIQASDGSNANTLTITSGTMNIAGNFINSDVFTYGTSTVNFNGTTPSTISGTTANTFYNLTAAAGKNIIFPAGVTQTIAASGSLNLNGSTAGMIHLRSSIPGTRWNISVPANQNVSYVDVKDSAQTNGTYTITDTNGNDGGNNNVYWVFSGTGNRFWVAPADGNWNSATNWSASSGGAANASIPTSGNTAVFDQAGGAGSYACTINTVVTVDNISVATYTNTITINALTTTNTDINMASGTLNAASAGTTTINGDLLLSGTATFVAPNLTLNIAGNFSNSATFNNSSGATTFTSTSPTAKTITSGTAHFYNLIFNGTGGSWTMADNSTTDNNFTITAGTVLGGSTTINIAGSYVSTATGIFTYGTSTVNLTGTGTITVTSATNGSFYNLTAAAASQTTTLGNNIWVYNVITLGTGTLASGNIVTIQGSGTPMVNGGATIAAKIIYRGSSAFNVASANYTALEVDGTGASIVGTLAGNISCTTLGIGGSNSGNISILDTNGYNITSTTSITIGAGTTYYGIIKNLSGSISTITATGTVTVAVPTVAGNNQLLANNQSWLIAGNYANNDVFTAGNSTITFTGAGTQTLNSGGVGAGKLFNNLTHSGAGTLQLLTNNLDVNGTFSQTAGTFNANAKNQNFAGDFSITGGTYTKGGTLTFDGTTSYIDTSTTPQNIGAVTMSGTSTTITSGTMQVDTIALTGGSLIQTAGGVKTTSTITTSGGTFWTNNGNGKVTLGGNVTNAGTLSFNGDEATYGMDPIAILSTAASARTWTLSGAGTFSFTDVSVSWQTGTAPITATSSNDGGNNTNWIFATTKVISGYLYNGIGGSLITAVKTIAVSVNGAAASTTTTDGTGFYTLTLASLPANNTVGVYVSGDAVKASCITKTAATADIGINIDLFQNYTALRHEGATTSLTNTDLDTADNVADADLLESVTASVPTFTQGIYILNNKTFAPGNNIVVQGSFANYGAFTPSTYTVTFDGTSTVLGTSITSFTNVTINNTKTMTGHATNMNVSGNFLNNGTFTHNSGTITFNGTTGQTFTDGAQTYNNIILNNTGTAGANERITVSGNLDINGNLTITDGALYLVTNNPTVNIAGNVAIAANGIVTKGSGTWTFDGTTTTTYADLAATTSDLGAVTLNKTDAGSPAVNNVLTATGNMKTNSLTIDGTSGQEDTLSIATTKTLTVTTGSTTTIQAGATISGAGTLTLTDGAGALLSTTGTLSSIVRFDAATADVIIPARTYGGNVEIYNGTSSARVATLGTATSQTINFAGLSLTTNSTGELWTKGQTYNPTVNVSGDFTTSHSSTGAVKTGTGTATWTFSGNLTLSRDPDKISTDGVNAPTGGTVVINGSGKTINCPNLWLVFFVYDLRFSGNTTLINYGGARAYHSLVVDNGVTVTYNAIFNGGNDSYGSGLEVYPGATTTVAGTITGTGTIAFYNSSGGLIDPGGTISSTVEFLTNNATSTVSARTYSGPVIFYGVWTDTIQLGTSAGQTINFGSNVTISRGTGQTGVNTIDGSVYNPMVNITGNISVVAPGSGTHSIKLGSGTWSVAGNIDFTNVAVVPGASTLDMNNANGLVTQTLNTNAQTLNNLTHSGAGTLQLVTNALTLNGTLTNSAGFFNANNLDLTIAGSLNNTATITNATTNTTTFNGTASNNTIRTNGSSLNNVTVNTTNVNLNNGLMGYWKLDEGAGTSGAIITDSSGNGNTATMNGFSGTPWTSTTPGSGYYVSDPYALTFTAASSQYLTAPDVAALNVGTGSFTVGAWVKPAATSSYRAVNKFLNSGAGFGWLLDINETTTGTNAPGYVRFRMTDSGTHNFDYAVDGTLGTGSWKYITATINRSTNELKLFVNGSQIGTTQDISAVTATLTGATTLGIGAIPSALGNYFGGPIDDVRLYNRVLGTTEIATLYGGTNPLGTYQLQDALTAAGNMTITAGTLDANGNNMTVGGNWSNADTFTPGANTVTFNKSTGTQTLNSGGTAAGKLFNNVTHSGAGTLQLITNTLNVDGNLTNSAGTLDSNSQNITLAGNYNTTGGTVTTGSSTVTFDAAVAQAITSASQPFYNLTLNNTGTGAGDDITPADALDINGTLTITDGQLRNDTNNINMTISGDLSIASGGTLTKGSGTITFDGALTPSNLTDSSSAAPQNLGFITINKNNIVTPAANLLTLASATSIDSVSIAASNTFNAAGYNITISGNWTNNGTFTAGAGTVTFDGTSTVLGTQATTFNNLTINNTKSLTGHATNMNMAGNYLNNGIFTSGTGTVTLNGSAAQSLTAGGTDDDHDLYNLVITNSAGPSNGVTFADSLTLHAGGTFTDNTPNSKLIFTTGATYNFPIIVINGSGAGDVTMTTTGGVWNFIVPGTPAVTYVTVDHSDATGSGAEIDATSNCHDGGSNTYWNFAPPFTPSISFSINSNTVTFANLNSVNSWTDTKTNTVTTTTNAPSGYTVQIYLTQALRSIVDPTKEVDNYAGTWATPTTWTGYGFGYTSNDPSVQGSDRFGSGTKYAGFTQTPSGDIAADNTAPATAEAFTITYKVAVTDFQTASTYRTYAIYIATANF